MRTPRGDVRGSAARDSWASETTAPDPGCLGSLRTGGVSSRVAGKQRCFPATRLLTGQLALADEEARQEARNHLDHLPVNRVLRPHEAIDQSFERLLPLRVAPRPRFEGHGDFLEVLDVAPDGLVFGPDG